MLLMRRKMWLYFRDQQRNKVEITWCSVAMPTGRRMSPPRGHFGVLQPVRATEPTSLFPLRIILLILSSCYLAFRVCSLEQQLSFLNPKLPLRER